MNHYDVAVKLGFIIEDGEELMASTHHPKSNDAGRFIGTVDFHHYDDALGWNFGGDGDNGELLKFELDAFFKADDFINNVPYEKDGEIAIVYRPSYGIGWSSYHTKNQEFLALNGTLAMAVETEDWAAVENIVRLVMGPDAYLGDINRLKLQWVKKGTAFEIEEHDGYERVSYRPDVMVAK